MTAYDHIASCTQSERAFLHAAPVITRALEGRITRPEYLSFLTQAYHHVRHTVPLLMAVGGRLGGSHQWLQKEIVRYIDEEWGHEQWILNDIAASGGDPEAAASSTPAPETDAMVAYAYDIVMRRNPAGFFGMVFVLEGTSVALALTAAERIQAALGLPDAAFTYLRSHGQLDQEHVNYLAGILERLDRVEDLPVVAHCARSIFWLYGSMFRAIERKAVATCS